MEDLEYRRKFSEMQKYVPFLDRVIEKLKNSDQDKPRKAQLEKMQTLHSLLHNKEKKLKIETLLKCELVLKKLHAKIEKSDDVIPLNLPSNSTTTSMSSNAAKDVHITGPASPAAQRATSTKNKFVPNRNLIEIYTCPASPTHLGEEDFRPPVEIPTERRSSPVKIISSTAHWEQEETIEESTIPSIASSVKRHPYRTTDFYHTKNTNSVHKFADAPKISRWSDSRDRTREISPAMSSSSYHRSWSSSSSSLSSSNNQQSHGQKRNESKYSSGEENWDDPEDKPLPKPKLDPKPTPQLTSPSYSSYKDTKSTHHHRHERISAPPLPPLPPLPPPPAYPPLPETNHDQDVFQNKIFHDTIYKYKKPEAFNSFMNPPPPESRTQKHSPGNIFNRLGDKVDVGFENFRIQVKNDKIREKSPHKAIRQTPPPPPPPLLVPNKPLGEVLKSPPLSADDIDDLLNESLEAGMDKQSKTKTNPFANDGKPRSLDAVRKKLALISKPASPPRLISPTRTENKVNEPFYRRGHTPIKKPIEVHEIQSPSEEPNIPSVQPMKNYPLPSPKSPPNEMEKVVERLALKYNPHKRRESVSFREKPTTLALPMKDLSLDPKIDSLTQRSKPSSYRESIVSPVHTVDPRVSKKIGHIPPLMAIPVPIPPVPNVLPTINHFDPRLRNTHPLNKDHIPFTVPKPYSPIPSLLDLHIKIPTTVPPAPLRQSPNPTRIDPRTQKSAKAYADKFNPERNDKTERMKYLESKKNKPPEPKTYGEYRQSKCRQQLEEETLHATGSVTAAPSIQSMTPSTLDKMYRNADYGKEITGSIQGFKIPKKPKPEEPKTDPKKDDQPKSEDTKNEPSNADPISKNQDKNEDDLAKKPNEEESESIESVKKVEEPQKDNEMAKQKEKQKRIEKLSKESKKQKNKKSKTKHDASENLSEVEVESAPITEAIENVKNTPTIDSQNTESQTKEPESKANASFNDSVTEGVLVIDEDIHSPIKSKDDRTLLADDSEQSPEPIINPPRRNLRRKNVIIDDDETPLIEMKKQENPSDSVEKELMEPPKEEPKPRRISTRRPTIIMKEPPEEVEPRESESSSPCQLRTRRRSASDIFSPTTDNSVVSTQNIISGKRKTRASINFNEKNTKKTPTPKATTATATASPSISQTPKPRAKTADTKQVTKKRNSVSAEQKKDTNEKRNSEDGQICAVSSTTEGPHNEPAVITEGLPSPDEPSSSNAGDPPTQLVDADNKKKQEFLEGFLMSIVDPTTNKDRIIEMLKSVLDDKKLQQVKEILYSPTKDDSKNISDKQDEHHDLEPEQSKPRVTRTKKNELDRLNEDIRDMFICQGVVTATGRRMCTIAKATSNKSPPAETAKKKKVQQPKPSEKSPDKSLLIKRPMRKAKVLISPLNMRALRSRNQKANCSPKMPVLEPNTPIKFSGAEDDEKVSESSDEEMPETMNKIQVKKSLTKKLTKKPGPKSKRLTSDDSDSSDDDIELVYLKNKIKRMDDMKIEEEKNTKLKVDKKKEDEKSNKLKNDKNTEMKSEEVKNKKLKNDTKIDTNIEEMKNKKLKSNKKTEDDEETKVESTKVETKVDSPKEKTTVDSAKEETKSKEEVKVEETTNKECKSTDPIIKEKKDEESDSLPKNTNPDHHTKSAYSNRCVICNERGRFIAPHYLIAHNDSEVYTSRLPASVLEDVKLNIGNRALYAINKKPQIAFKYNCPFCDFPATYALRGWMEHFTIHTGEYAHKCSKCFKAMNGSSHMMDHIKRFCPDAKKINRDPINIRGNAILGYVCHICNFVQMLRGGVIRHLKVQHGLEDVESIGSIIEVKLIDSAGVPKKEESMENLSAAEMSTSSINTSVLTAPDNVSIGKVNESIMIMSDETTEDPLKICENDEIVVKGSIAKLISTSGDTLAEIRKIAIIDDEEQIKESSKEPNEENSKESSKQSSKDLNNERSKKSRNESNMSINSHIEAFLPRDVISPNSITCIDLTEHSTSMAVDDIIDLDSSVNMVCTALTEKPVAEKSRTDSTLAINSNMEVFLPRDLASPTSLVLTERLKSIEKDDDIASDSGVHKNNQAEKKITIAERLSQRFKNIEKQNIAEIAITDKNSQNATTEKASDVVPLATVPTDVDMVIQETHSTREKTPPINSPVSTQSLNESDNLIIDEQIQNNSLERDNDGSESDDGNQNDEDDNDNWEDIEITETTKGGSNKDKNKNKSIFQTLSRLYASIAPKKSSKKVKDKEKKKVSETIERSEKSDKTSIAATSEPTTPAPAEDPPLLAASASSLSKPTPQQQHQRIPNLSEFLPDSPGDSLDMILTNFNCLDGSSFPHLDLNDLDSSIFTLPEEQENIQDAIDMVTDMDNVDVLGNPLSLSIKPQQQQQTSSSIQPSSIQKIGNFGFSLNGNSFKYYCMVKSCAFLFSDHPDGLQNHFLLEHPSLKWDGYCSTCKMQVSYGDFREMKHMLDVHSKTKIDDSSDKPRIKFRRLTGDILSTDKPKIDNNLSNQVQFAPFDNAPSCIEQSSTVSSQNDPPPTARSYTPELSLSTMLQSQPKAMIPPKAPPKIDMDIPLFKNVSREFTITNVAEGVTDNDLLNLMFKQADSTPGGIQISQVISLNAGGKSVSPTPLMQISDRITASEQRSSPALRISEQRSSPALREISSSIKEKEKQSPRASPKPNSMNATTTQRNSPLPQVPIAKESSYICCVNKCSFFTNIRSAMNEHILSHIRIDNNREALKCHACSFLGQDTNHYFHHMTHVHSRCDNVAPSCASTVELTQKIQDILRTTSKKTQPSENDHQNQPIQRSQSQTNQPNQTIQINHTDQTNTINQPSAEDKTTRDRDLSFPNRLRKTAEEIVAETGLPEEDIWRCIFYPECDGVDSEKDFQSHLATHTSIVPTSFPSISPGSSLYCPHCTVNYYRPAMLKHHIKSHARHRIFCYGCSLTTFINLQQAQKHFADIHSHAGVPRTRSMIPGEISGKPAFLVASETELTSMELRQFGEKLLVDWERKKAQNKTHFKPNEQNLLPIQPIFNNQVYCSVCNYKTKVRTNMFRHLQLHNQDVDVGSVDPVNPVPCLEKNEKHFDKMLNLACSSNTGSSMKPKENVKIPVFVPDMRRYVCGHPGCKYLTITDQMLRSHLNALHGQEKGYLCPHCQEEICKKNMCTERVVQHLKFHGSKIYQCSECEYFHYTKHVVERHVNEKHVGVPFVNMLTFDRNENETKKSSQLIAGRNVTSSHSVSSECDSAAETPATSSTPPNSKMKWECAICKHQTATWNQMISHANSLHNAKHQYHCVHCTFGSAHLAHIMDHIDTKHPSKIREAKYVFYKINETLQDKAADTRPLWSRNDPKRVRSIRGILMENEEDAERTKKSLSSAGVDLDDEDDEVVPVYESETSMIPGGLACFHCNFTSVEISSLSHHWKTKHWHEKNGEMVPRIPFFFRIHTALKCPLCPHVGDHITLKIHLINVHGQRNFCAADPNVPNSCGHCTFVYQTKRLDVLTNHYLREHKPSDAKHLSSGLLKNLLALGECQVYMQCYFCAEICADKTAIIDHERERHKNSNFRYKQIKDEVIYRCGMCQYSSTNELATLRHMIDHFGGFSVCHFCKTAQSSFNSYMQHCYTFHMKALASFKVIYDCDKISSFLGQMLLIFPNGLIVAKKNLLDTQYGNTERIRAMYDEICKKALEPPIPPLSMGRLLAAKKSLEISTQPLLPPPAMAVTAKRIAKRRSTVAMGGCDRDFSNFLVPSEPQKIKKRKSSICGDFLQPTAPLFSTITVRSSNADSSEPERFNVAEKPSEPQGFSFYGKKPDPIDLSKIYTHIAIGDKYAPVSVKKFSLLFKINTKVLVEPVDHRKFKSKKRSATFSRPCPASKKKKIA